MNLDCSLYSNLLRKQNREGQWHRIGRTTVAQLQLNRPSVLNLHRLLRLAGERTPSPEIPQQREGPEIASPFWLTNPTIALYALVA